jgi:two-component system, cell cycle sensor histidine kinase and response regulator CckA
MGIGRDLMAEPRKSVGKLRILVIDDEPAVGRAMKRVLRDHDVSMAISGTEGIEQIEQHTFDLVICDLVMHGVSGMEVYERVCASRPEMAERFSFITAGGLGDLARRFVEKVKRPLMEKPTSSEELKRLVKTLIEKQSLDSQG